ncbi:hypothetical protein [Desulfobacula sp.]|uniref:hypothetical protein n=1 Tax=Desulfobacula sp. TaxID=2593537 RepID=UPI002633EFC3|nr:hypothetical protein [Desulfobacula sp.]
METNLSPFTGISNRLPSNSHDGYTLNATCHHPDINTQMNQRPKKNNFSSIIDDVIDLVTIIVINYPSFFT